MDSSKTAMENVFFHHHHAVLDMKALEMEIVSQYKWKQNAQMDMRVMEMVSVFWFLDQLMDQLQHQYMILKNKNLLIQINVPAQMNVK